ncbi:hypothetical protein Z959_10380 [Clostridium novyi B str. ATCC 27606]|uniref:Insecticidal crystal toxin domain-containing protein n=2 Tax=Clostridium TaxID=1485 RepID=A0AA40M2M5_CLONO|nr:MULTISPECIES: hypothetical protein [Clostridium]KEI13906.1 hypothetical protein Z958_01400 [Clostridium novyi B str. NCTC 9691]KEI16104.1 hypothetical protein Z960_10805 [Clostridium haemolyticum NCTC 9693]KEI16279.1 hypothetical protein Z959_10380 [Clostridium novyi B str. ATCC 27606]KGN04469.1 hypothetical protein Z961_02995 [Clostridium haemolyticum NCTC 8350]OOB75531.1 hypothetical protein AXF41_07875 [Clostridium haemolyticum]
MKKKLALLVLTALLLGPVSSAKAYDRDITIPTQSIAVVDGKIKSQIDIQKETSTVNPWLYVDIKLDATKSKMGKYNYGELALKRAIGFMIENSLSLKEGDFSIILNNGFVINRNNFKDSKITNIVKKEILDKDFYRGDTLFKVSFLYHDNSVQRTTCWKLIDTIDLPAGSSHTLNKSYTVGITKNEEFDMGQALGLKLITEAGGSASGDFKFVSASFSSKLTNDLNFTVSKNFKNSKEIKSSFESTTNIAYTACDKDKVILRYQLVDNYKVDPTEFKKGTEKLEKLMNQGGVNIVKVAPAAGEIGIDVPIDKIFDVTLYKE